MMSMLLLSAAIWTPPMERVDPISGRKTVAVAASADDDQEVTLIFMCLEKEPSVSVSLTGTVFTETPAGFGHGAGAAIDARGDNEPVKKEPTKPSAFNAFKQKIDYLASTSTDGLSAWLHGKHARRLYKQSEAGIWLRLPTYDGPRTVHFGAGRPELACFGE